MFSELEHNCLRRMAARCRNGGLDRAQTIAQIEADIGGFCTRFHIQQAVQAVFNPLPDLTWQ
jgi:hypothetical protein